MRCLSALQCPMSTVSAARHAPPACSTTAQRAHESLHSRRVYPCLLASCWKRLALGFTDGRSWASGLYLWWYQRSLIGFQMYRVEADGS